MTIFQVSHPVTWIVTEASAGLPSTLYWSSADPVAVKACFGHAGDDRKTTDWFFGRDLLADVAFGRCASAGDGDVHVARVLKDGREVLILTLSVGTVVHLQADLEEIKFFLEATFIYSPQGQEEIDMDTAIGRLLDGGWASGV
jgi:hypothetical protein